MSRIRGLVHACSLSAVLGVPWVFANTITVQPADSLWSLARQYDTTVAALKAANGLSSDLIKPGQVLQLPTAEADSNVAEGGAFVAAAFLAPDTDLVNSMVTVASPPVVGAPAMVAAAVAPSAAAAVAAAPAPAPAPAVQAAAAPAAEAATVHRVQAGDALYSIAVRYGVSVDDLIVWNQLDGTLIRPGQELRLAAAQDAPPAPALSVQVQAGDSLWGIARAHDTTVEALAAANGISSGSVLRVGQSLVIPGRYEAVHATTGAPTADVGGPAPTEIRVLPGDNLWTLARQHDTSIASLMNLNGLSNDRLTVGQVLRVMPGPDVSVAAAAAVAGAAAPQPEMTTGMVWPLVGLITSEFGWRRLRIAGSNMHYGLDIDGDTGDPIRSATEGTVTFAGWRGGFGNLVIVSNGSTDYYYAHASALLVRAGESVGPGQLIARVGATGNATGSHLHFEIRVDGTPVDPLPILEARASR